VKELLPACFGLFTALLVWPLPSIANRPRLVGGAPALVLYLFGVWVVIVAVLLWAAWRLGGPDQESGP